MNRKKLARAIGVCTLAIVLVVVITIIPSCVSQTPTPTPTLVTYDCTNKTASSLKGQGEVTNIGSQLLSRRGFVWLEGDREDPAFYITPIALVNPSFEEGNPPKNWTYKCIASRSMEQVKVGSYSLKLTSNGTWQRAEQKIPNYADYAGKRVIIALWYYAPSTDNVQQRILISDGVNITYSNILSQDDTWHWIMFSRTIASSPTTLLIQLMVNHSSTPDSDDILYIDGVILFTGNAVFEDGEFNTGIYSLTIGGLKHNTSYRVRAFGENEVGIGYGNTVTCKTLAE